VEWCLCVSQQCDANDYYDSDKFMGKMMERDLRQMLFRRRFTRLLPENILEVRLGQPNPNPSPHRLRASTRRRHQPQKFNLAAAAQGLRRPRFAVEIQIMTSTRQP
jgi:hypothetical protein